MQCIQLRRGDPPQTTVDVVLSGSLSSSYSYVEIDGTKYASAQTVKVAKGTSVTVFSSGRKWVGNNGPKITLNGEIVASVTNNSGASYTFTVTDNCSISFTHTNYSVINYYTAAITMPAT